MLSNSASKNSIFNDNIEYFLYFKIAKYMLSQVSIHQMYFPIMETSQMHSYDNFLTIYNLLHIASIQ